MSPPDFQALLNYSPVADLLAERVILVTGAASGIGRAVAAACAHHGAQTILLDSNRKALESLCDELVDAGRAEPGVVALDMAEASTKDYRALSKWIAEEFGRLDGLLNNAGWIGALTPLEHVEPQMWGRVLTVNLAAAFFLTQWCLPLLRQAPDAALGFSLHHTSRAFWGPYGIAKAGLESLMHIAANEYDLQGSQPVRVFGIDTGPVTTAERRAHYPGELPEAHPGPEAVVGPYLYALGPDARGFTDFVLAPDGAAGTPATA